jgi:hypothetical protein
MQLDRKLTLPMLAFLALGIAVHGWILSQRKPTVSQRATPVAAATPARDTRMPTGWTETRTAHYLVVSNASAVHIARTGEAVEHLHAAWLKLFDDMPAAQREHAPLRLVLYKTRAEFKANNRATSWAEAVYRPPECHAYVGQGPNPYHWMVHEAAHQLAREVMGFRRVRWIDEGLAGYLGASRIDAQGLHPGTMDPHTYPLWWLPQFQWTGNLEADVRDGRIIPLQALIDDTGPPIAAWVNLYYIEYWSLTHFLLQAENGRYAAGYKRLLANGASAEDFEREIGPIWQIQIAWYAWLREQRAQMLRQQDVVVPVSP